MTGRCRRPRRCHPRRLGRCVPPSRSLGLHLLRHTGARKLTRGSRGQPSVPEEVVVVDSVVVVVVVVGVSPDPLVPDPLVPEVAPSVPLVVVVSPEPLVPDPL